MKKFSIGYMFTALLTISCAQVSEAMNKAEVKKIVILHSYPEGDWYYGINSAIEQALKSNKVSYELSPLVFHAEFWRDEESERRIGEKNRILSFIKEKKPDFVLMCDDEVSDFIAADLAAMKLPVIFTGINREKNEIPWLNLFDKNQIAGTLELYQTEKSVSLLKRLKPNVKTFSILTSQSGTSQLVTQQIARDMANIEKKSNVKLRTIYKFKFWSEWKTAIEQINAHDDAAWILVPYDVRDENGEEVSVERIGLWIKKNLRKPSLGVISVSTKIGVLAGISSSPQGLGRQMGEQVVSYLSGKSLSEIGIEKMKYFEEEINVNQAKRLGINLKNNQPIQGFVPVQEAKLKYGR